MHACTQAHTHRADLYPECSNQDLEYSNRQALVLQEVARYSPDVLCLQEVDHAPELMVELESLGWVKAPIRSAFIYSWSWPDGCGEAGAAGQAGAAESLNPETGGTHAS